MRMYATVAQTRKELEDDVALEPVLLDQIQWASARVDEIMRQVYEPVFDTRYFDAVGDHINFEGDKLALGYPLLSAVTIIDGKETTLSVDDYRLLPRGHTPYRTIQRLDDLQWTRFDTIWTEVIEVTGIWGFRRDYASAWKRVTALAAAIDADETTLTFDDVSALSPGHLLKLDSEYVRTLAVNEGDSEITVERGANGTTAAAHLDEADVSIWRPEPLVTRAVLVAVKLMYNMRGTAEVSTYDANTGVAMKYPEDLPGEARGILKDLPRNITIRTV